MDSVKKSHVLPAALLTAVIIFIAGCEGTPTDGGGYGNNRNWSGNYLRIHLTPEQQPLLGEYSSRDPGVIQQHVLWAGQAAVDFFAIPWRGLDSWGHETLVDYVLPEPAFDDIDWCILYETPTVLEGNENADVVNLTLAARDTLISHLLEFRRRFFVLGNYLHIDGYPVVIMRQSRKIAGDARLAINAVRLAYADSTIGEGFYLIGDEVIWGAVDVPNSSRIGAMDAITGIDLGVLGVHNGYPLGTAFMQDLSALWQEYSLVVQGLDFPIPIVPMVFPGYNDRVSSAVLHPVITRELSSRSSPLGGTYSSMWEIANTRAGDPAIVLLNSFNDWRHDTQIEIVADNRNPTGTFQPTTATGGFRYFPYQNLYIEETSLNKGNVLLGAIYEVWYDNHPPSVSRR